jgi:hypothetical protein
LTFGVLLAVSEVLIYDNESRFDLVAASTALLFALPSLRSATPGIPDSPTVYDSGSCSSEDDKVKIISLFTAVGYFWNIALLGISAFALICHSIWHMHVRNSSVGCL